MSGTAFRTKDNAWVSGLCGCPTNPPGSHALCSGTDGERACRCSCHLKPGSPEWCRRVSPSKAAAILGISPWDSQRSMWHKMRGEIPWDEETEAMERGTLCEPAVLAWWRKHHEHTDWREQVTLTVGDWCVATPDGIAQVSDDLEMVEAKTAANMDDWGDPGTDVIPAYYLTQVYLSMHVCHLNGLPVARANVPVLGGYRLLFSNYVVEYDAAIGADLLARMKTWADALDGDEPPDLDGSVATYDAIRKLHPDIDRGESVELTPDEAREYVEAMNAYRAADDRARAAKTVAYDRAGRAQYLTCGGVKIARRQPNRAGVHLVQIAKSADDIPNDNEGSDAA